MLINRRALTHFFRFRIVAFLEQAIIPVFLVSSLLLIGLITWKSVQGIQLAATIHETDVRLDAENKILSTGAQVFAGTFVLVGLYFTAKSVFVSREGQITDRFSKALENLSDTENILKRIGGIHALERIARDSPYDHWTVMEIFTDYVRNKTSGNASVAAKPEGDIQAILNALGRRSHVWRIGETRPLNLRGVKLVGADLQGAHLAGADLSGASLKGAILFKANLEKANFSDADLEGANLNQTSLKDANLYRAILRNAQLRNAKCIKTSFAEAQLEDASLDESRFKKAAFTRANLNRVSLVRAKLIDCYFNDASLTDASLEGTEIIRPYALAKD